MIKIFNSKQIKSWDVTTIQRQSISSLELMERAATAFSKEFKNHFQLTVPVVIICGVGNNGGDGLAIGRILYQEGYTVRCFIVGDVDKGTGDFLANLERATQLNLVTRVTSISEIILSDNEVVIDGLFGTGLSRPVTGLEAQVIGLINLHKNSVIAIDIPSGLYPDRTADGPVIQATNTFTFQVPKLTFFFPENEIYVGKWKLLDIGLDQKFNSDTSTSVCLLEASDISNDFITRSRFAHKGNNGHLLLVAGSYGKIGASVLAAHAALRSGCGLVTVYIPGCGYQVIQTALPEAMVITDPEEKFISDLPELKVYGCVAVGPGLGTHPATVRVVENLLTNCSCPLVIDADALNIISENPGLISLIPKHSILTPHPGEFRRLAGSWKNDTEKFEKLKDFAKKIELVIVLKGAYTLLAMPDGSVYINQTGNSYMATSGCGDVLTGMIAALICQGYTAQQAAKMGVWLHGLSGDIATQGRFPILAGDLITQIPQAWNQLFGQKTADFRL